MLRTRQPSPLIRPLVCVATAAVCAALGLCPGCGGDGPPDSGALGDGGSSASGGARMEAGGNGSGGLAGGTGGVAAGTGGVAGGAGAGGAVGAGGSAGGGTGRDAGNASGGTAGSTRDAGIAADTGAGDGARGGQGGAGSPDLLGPDGASDGAGGQGDAGSPAVQLLGRFDHASTPSSFDWSGSQIVARFTGTGVSLQMSGSPNQFAVVLDGTLSATVLKVTGSSSSYPVASGLSAGTHDLVLWKRTEGSQGSNAYQGLTVTGGQLVAPPARPTRRIEIYGDSISAGYGMDGQGPSCTASQDNENHYLTYGAVAARTLSAELHTIAWSGIGMYRNYGQSGPSPDAMPAVYDRMLASSASSASNAWDFSSWQPDAVVINLGTNDASTSGDPGTPYRTAYLDFVTTLRQKYPNTFFVLTIGPMLSGAALDAIRGHLQAVIQTRAAAGDTRMSYLEFPVQTGSSGYGCDWHPSPATNASMAAQLVTELKARLSW